LEGELCKLGFAVGAATIRTVLLRYDFSPAPNVTAGQYVACDVFTDVVGESN
jgi:hypothetical protein